ELIPREVAGKINIANQPAGDRRAYRCAQQHFRKVEVINITRSASDFVDSLFAGDRLADNWLLHFGSVSEGYGTGSGSDLVLTESIDSVSTRSLPLPVPYRFHPDH